ncbi:MAG TPA: hypothetical protein VII73_06875 [Caulobacteraceae bacterium]
MSAKPKERGIREAVGLFETQAALQAAVDELLGSGFDRADISLLASEHAMADTLGQVIMRSTLEDDPSTPRGVYVSPDAFGVAEGSLISVLALVGGVATAGVIALAGGPLTAIAIGTGLAGGAGGLIGAGLAKLLGDRRAADIQSHLAAGGLLLWVRTWHSEDEVRATDILARHSGRDVHTHSLSGSNLAGRLPLGDAL